MSLSAQPAPVLQAGFSPRIGLLLVVLAVATVILYGVSFPSEPDLDPFDITKEVAFFLAVLILYRYMARAGFSLLDVGFLLFLQSLWMEVVDEFTAEPRWMGTAVPAPIGITGIVVLAVAARIGRKRREEKEARHAESEEALRKSHSTLQAVIEGTPDPVWVKDLEGAYLLANAACIRAIGRPLTDIIGNRDEDLLPADAAARSNESDRDALASGGTIRFEDTVTIGGELRTFLVSKGVVRDTLGNAVGILCIARDITDRKAVEDQLAHQASHDMLTGLPNRALFLERLERALTRARRQPGHVFGVLFLDIDRFKDVNDRYGHAVGDELLVNFTRALNHWLRPGDVIARLSGDEFTVLLPDIAGLDDAVHVAERIRQGLRAPLQLRDEAVATTVSIGVALSSPAYERAEDLVRDADSAMYRAKQMGRDRHAVYADEPTAPVTTGAGRSSALTGDAGQRPIP
ncbi:MAG: GGDEF domain-containing protein [Gemmatimonadetes bacterium]|nr:GGDEF domain-containing protein [Gemmatimonadota bacterium]